MWKQKFKFDSLQKRIAFTFTILIFFQILFFAIISYWLDIKSIHDQVSEANLLTLNEMRNRLETEIKVLERVSLQLSKTSQIQQYLLQRQSLFAEDENQVKALQNEVSHILEFTAQSWPEISNMYVHNLAGHSHGFSNTDIAVALPKLRDLKPHQKTVIDYGIPLNQPYTTQSAVISFFRLVEADHAIQPIGWIQLDFILNEMQLLKDLQDDPRKFLVFEPNGKLILSNHPDELDIVFMAKILNIKETRGSILYKENLINYTKSDHMNWRIVSIVPEKILNEDLIRNQMIAILLVAVSFILSALASTALSYRIAKPIRSLYRSMKRVEEGKLQTRVEVNSQDEIGQLGQQMNKMMDSIEQLIQKLDNTELRYRDTQFKMLSMQINPHFLYNTLEIIDISSMKGNHKAVSETIYALTGMFRYVLKSQQFAMLQKEVDHVKAYMKIQKIRYPDNFHYDIQIDPEHMRYEVPVFILQPIIENAFKHGFFQKDRNVISIRTEIIDGILKIYVVDNGKGISHTELTHMRNKLLSEQDHLGLQEIHIGLQNVHHRIIHAYGKPYGLKIDSLQHYWFKVTITLPDGGK